VRSLRQFPGQSFRSVVILLGALGVWLALPGLGWGQTVSLQAQVIYAANQPGGVDSRLGSLAGNLQKTFRYSMYQLLDAPKGSATLNQTWRTGLPDKRSLEITPTAIQDGQYNLTVRVLGVGGQPSVNTAVRLRRGATVLVGGGPPYQQGVLIIAISAN
jgi:hypothetical protein